MKKVIAVLVAVALLIGAALTYKLTHGPRLKPGHCYFIEDAKHGGSGAIKILETKDNLYIGLVATPFGAIQFQAELASFDKALKDVSVKEIPCDGSEPTGEHTNVTVTH